VIRINLVDNTASVKHVDFLVIPVTNDKDSTCTPDGLLSLRAIMRLSRELRLGRVFGELGKFLWYRLRRTAKSKQKGRRIGQVSLVSAQGDTGGQAQELVCEPPVKGQPWRKAIFIGRSTG
jgi:hypothetical protein